MAEETVPELKSLQGNSSHFCEEVLHVELGNSR